MGTRGWTCVAFFTTNSPEKANMKANNMDAARTLQGPTLVALSIKPTTGRVQTDHHVVSWVLFSTAHMMPFDLSNSNYDPQSI